MLVQVGIPATPGLSFDPSSPSYIEWRAEMDRLHADPTRDGSFVTSAEIVLRNTAGITKRQVAILVEEALIKYRCVQSCNGETHLVGRCSPQMCCVASCPHCVSVRRCRRCSAAALR
jgi:hypothetical protein